MTAPLPRLTYWLPNKTSGLDIPVEEKSPRLFSAHDVTATARRGEVEIVVTGAFLKKDGTRGAHRRCAWVDLDQPLPSWLAEIVSDARARLGVTGDE